MFKLSLDGVMSRVTVIRMKYYIEKATTNVNLRTYSISRVFFVPTAASYNKTNRKRVAERETATQNTNQTSPEETRTEAEWLRRLGNDPDTFGTLGDKRTSLNVDYSTEVETGEKYETFRYRPFQPRKWQKYYVNLIKEYSQQKNLKGAIDVLEKKMLKEDGAKPAYYIYSLLITACARAGYSKKAFQLYNQMKKRGLKVTAPVYTSLFNACANSPFPKTSLKLAVNLRKLMDEKGVQPNVLNYHAMIKAFGRCGDLVTALSIFDEMVSKNYTIKDDTFNNLFQACISDKNAGFYHVLLAWRKLLHMKVAPNVESYNLVLRAARECSLGGNESAQELLQMITEKSVIQSAFPEKSFNIVESTKLISATDENDVYTKSIPVPVISEVSNKRLLRNSEEKEERETFSDISELDSKELTLIPLNEGKCFKSNLPNFLASEPNIGNVISLKEITKPEDRLLLLGGYSGVLDSMASMGVKPNIKTFTLLLDCIEPTIAAENELISAMKKTKVKPDIDFFNMLIRRRNLRADYKAGNDVVKFIHKEKLVPNVMTFGVLAIGCQNDVEAKSLINDMQSAGYRMNAEILGALLGNSCFHFNFVYVKLVMDTVKNEDIHPNSKFLETLENFDKLCKKLLQDKKNPVQDESKAKLEKHFKAFTKYYNDWLKNVVPETEQHPWKQYRD